MSIDPLLKLAPSSCAPHPHVVVLLDILLRAILFGHLVWGTISRCSRFYSSGRPIQLGPGPGPPGYTGCSLVPTPSGLAQLSGVSPRVNGSDEGGNPRMVCMQTGVQGACIILACVQQQYHMFSPLVEGYWCPSPASDGVSGEDRARMRSHRRAGA